MLNIRKAIFRVKHMDQELEELKTKILKVTTMFNDMPRIDSNRNVKEENIAAYIDLYNDRMSQSVKIDKTIADYIKQIEQLPEPEYKVMYCRYILEMDWETVCDRLHYSPRSCYRLHDAAQKKLAVNGTKM